MPGRRRRGVLTVALALGLAMSLGSPGAAAKPKRKPPPPEDVEATGGPVSITWQWTPAEVTIPVGGRVRWTNDSGAPHNVTAYSPNWDVRQPIQEGSPVIMRFTEPGTYDYYCDVISHGFVAGDVCIGMCGSVVVE